MIDLSAQLRQSYAAHPGFQFGQVALPLDNAKAAEFAEAYEGLRGSKPCQAVCEAAISAIFADLRAPLSDHFTLIFLNELEAECARLLRDEADTYREASARPLDSPISGRHRFGQLQDEVVERLIAATVADVELFRSRAASGRFSREELSSNTGRSVHTAVTILNREFKRLGVNAELSAQMGKELSVTGLAVELSVPQASWWSNGYSEFSRAPKTMYAHLDEAIGLPKAIVYLSDVDELNGPTSCYPTAYESLRLQPIQELVGRVLGNVGRRPGSPLAQYYQWTGQQTMSSEAFRRHFMLLPEDVRFNSHFGWDVLPDSPLEASLVSLERPMIGPAGSFIVFDGSRLLHRGGMVSDGDRIALQVVFSSPTIPRRLLRRVRGGIR